MSAAAQDSGYASRPLGIRDVLRLRDYRRVWLGQVVSDVGDATTFLLLLLVINDLTHSTTAIAVMSIALAAPRFTIGLVAGVYVDRWDRRRTMLAADLLRAVIVLGFVLAQSASLVPMLVLLGLLEMSVSAFFTPARNALLPHVVPREGLPAANSLAQATIVCASVVGSGVAGLLFGVFHTAWPGFVLDALTFIASFAMILRVSVSAGRIDRDDREQQRAPTGILGSLRDGLDVVRHSRLLVGTVLGAATLMLGIGAVNVLFVPLLVDDLRVAPAWMAAVDGAQAISMVLAAAIVAWLMARLRPTTIIPLALAGMGLFTVALAGVTSIWHVLALLFAVGWIVTPLQAALATVIQTSVVDAMRGRVGSLLSAATSTANVTSMALAGVFADLLTTRTVYLLAGASCFAAALVAYVTFAGIQRDAELVADAGASASEAT